MEQTVLISLPIGELQTVIIDCVTACLKNNKPLHETNSIDPDRWFGIRELCEYLPTKLSRQTIYDLVHKRQIPVHKQGKHLAFLKSEIDAWLKQGRKKTLAELASEADTYLKTKNGGK